MNILEAKHILKSTGYNVIREVSEIEPEVEEIAPITDNADTASNKQFTLYIQHTTSQEFDMRDKRQRHSFYRLGGKRLREATDSTDYGNMGGSRYNGKSEENVEQFNFSWTWVDVKGLTESLTEYGATLIDEEHTKARVERELDDYPVVDWGHDGPYGENSNYVETIQTTTSRYWYFTVSDPDNEVDEDLMKTLIAQSMPAVVAKGIDDYDEFTVTMK